MTQTRTHDRRSLLLGGGALIALSACGPRVAAQPSKTEAAFANSPFRKITDAEWKKRLPPKSYAILRHEDTEFAGTGPFLKENRPGRYHCLGCDLPLFESKWKYDSRTGWPSFYDAIRTNIGTKIDELLGYERVEYHCARCLGHQGHIFEDGPKPTGLRYCNNGYALKFVAA